MTVFRSDTVGRDNRVFICYGSNDLERALDAVTVLEAAGFSCWIAPRDVPPGSDWLEVLIEALKASRCLLLISSSHAESSPHVLSELNQATKLRLPIVTLRIESGEPSERHQYFIGVGQWTSRLQNLPVAV